MRLLLAEDEKELSTAVAAILNASGYETDIVSDGVQAVEAAERNSYDCMVFDIMMPGKDGITALSEIREKGDVTPVIMLTAKSEVDDRITGLDAGADDYLTKPFAVKELLARIRSVTRRNGETFTPHLLTFANLEFNTETQEVKGENTIRLSSKEGKLLRYFLLNPEKELTTETVFTHVWNDAEEETTSIVWVYISYLRQKLESVQAHVQIAGEEGGTFCLKVKE